jgi:hypothetical protein
MSKGKGKAGTSGPTTKAAAGSSGQGSSSQGSSGQGRSRPSAPPARIIGLRTEEDAVQAAPPLAAEAAGGAQQTEPAPVGSTKKEKEKLRKERQRQRKVEEAWEVLRGAVERMEETAGAGCVEAVDEAMQAAALSWRRWWQWRGTWSSRPERRRRSERGRRQRRSGGGGASEGGGRGGGGCRAAGAGAGAGSTHAERAE